MKRESIRILSVLFCASACGPSLDLQLRRYDAYCPNFGAALLIPNDQALLTRNPDARVPMRDLSRMGERGENEVFAQVPLTLVANGQTVSTVDQLMDTYHSVCRGVMPKWLDDEMDRQVARGQQYCANWGHVTLSSADAADYARDKSTKLAIREERPGLQVEVGEIAFGKFALRSVKDEAVMVPAELLVNGYRLDDEEAVHWEMRDAVCGLVKSAHRDPNNLDTLRGLDGAQKYQLLGKRFSRLRPERNGIPRPKWTVLKHKLVESKKQLSEEQAEQEHAKRLAQTLVEKLAALEKQVGDTPTKLETARARILELAAELMVVRTLTYSLEGRISSRLADRVFLGGANAEPIEPEDPLLAGIQAPDAPAAGLLSNGPALLLDPKSEDIQMGTGVEASGLYFIGLNPAVNSFGQKTSVFTYTHRKPPNPKEDDVRKKLVAAAATVKSLDDRLRPLTDIKAQLQNAEAILAVHNEQVAQLKSEVMSLSQSLDAKQAE